MNEVDRLFTDFLHLSRTGQGNAKGMGPGIHTPAFLVVTPPPAWIFFLLLINTAFFQPKEKLPGKEHHLSQ
jgi:hypothetical protein